MYSSYQPDTRMRNMEYYAKLSKDLKVLCWSILSCINFSCAWKYYYTTWLLYFGRLKKDNSELGPVDLKQWRKSLKLQWNNCCLFSIVSLLSSSSFLLFLITLFFSSRMSSYDIYSNMLLGLQVQILSLKLYSKYNLITHI